MTRDHDPATRTPFGRGTLASATGCNPETIRYYERIGLLPPPARSAAGHRVYSARDVQRLAFIMRARELGFPLEDIRTLLGLEDGTVPTCGEVKALAERHLAVIRTKLADLKRIESVLAETAARCSGADVPACPVLAAIALTQAAPDPAPTSARRLPTGGARRN